ncbi:MAG TPA: 2-C-methyl-D-erythritol 4-phosphate cytidylyltransferase [Ktedonobacteraceae bacterium]|nr:2-C-methyl-D-erythritol 4-phosphate cytidylyltransferase [Ktedonobacteraceae bacterium]
MNNICAAIIVAAGSSRRMQGRDKLWMPLAGRLTLARTVDVFDASPIIDRIVLVINAERTADAAALCQQEGWRKFAGIVAGGSRRQDSVRLGLDALAEIAPQCRWVMIHDGARPLVTPTMLQAGLRAAQQHQAAIAAIPIKDTIKRVEHDFVTATIDRSQHVAIQTPQVFSFPLIHQAHLSPEAREDVTDDAALLERLGQRVAIFPGSYTNIKITTLEDVLVAEAFIKGAATV